MAGAVFTVRRFPTRGDVGWRVGVCPFDARLAGREFGLLPDAAAAGASGRQEVVALCWTVATLPRPIPRGVTVAQQVLVLLVPGSNPGGVTSRHGWAGTAGRPAPGDRAEVLFDKRLAAPWCNGSTTGSGPVCKGSNPFGVTTCASSACPKQSELAAFSARGAAGPAASGRVFRVRGCRWRGVGSDRSCQRCSRRPRAPGRRCRCGAARHPATAAGPGSAPRTIGGCGQRPRS